MMQAEQINWIGRIVGGELPLPQAVKDGGVKDADGDAARDDADGLSGIEQELRNARAEQVRADEQRKQFVLDSAMRVIDPLKPQLKEAFDVGFANTGKSKILKRDKVTRQRDFLAKDGDLTKSGDVRDIKNAKLTKGGKEGASGVDFDEIQQGVTGAYGGLRTLRKQLEAETTKPKILSKDGSAVIDGPPVPLFTRDEMIDELFQPLVRAKILPDTFIEDGLSKTQKMLDATNALYKKDLADPDQYVSRSISQYSKNAIDVGTGMTKTVLEALGNDGTAVQDALTGATEVAKTFVDGANLADTRRRRKLKADDINGFLSDLPDMFGQCVGAKTGDSSLQGLVSAACTVGGTAAQAVVQEAMKEGRSKNTTFGQFLGALVSSGMTAVIDKYGSTSAQGQDAQAINDSVGKMLTIAGSDEAAKIADLLWHGQLKEARGSVARLLLDVAAACPPLASDIGVREGSSKDTASGFATDMSYDPGSKDVQANLKLDVATAGKDVQSKLDATLPKKEEPKVKNAADERMEALRKEFAEKNDKALLEELEAETAEEVEAFKARLRGDDKVSRNQHKIEDLISELKRDRAILSLLVAIGTGAADVAGQFVAYAAVGTEMVKLAANAKKVYERARALYDVLKERKSARGTASAYGSSIDNVVGNMEFQITAATLNGAMNGLKAVISVVAAAVPHAAPAVPAASTVQLALATTLQGIQTAKLRAAWQMTKKAFRDPKNRRLGLKVRKMNPTLAKYTIGYGAVAEEDPIAVSMAMACGIDEEALKNPGTNVAKVKAYLEAKFPDDGSVKGHWDEVSWQENLPDPAVTMVALAKLYGAVNKQYNKIAKVPPSDLAGLVAVVQTKIDPKETRPDVCQERCELLKQVDQAFVRAGKTAAKQAEASDVAPVFAEFADAAADLALVALLQVKTLEAEAAEAGPARAAA
jgi:hypothetical protein